ncbi:MAG: hypothetical protein K9H16_00900 [Bacteroidales bacterium]|nr:hypothetical protein [Bacteroidales bacterium]
MKRKGFVVLATIGFIFLHNFTIKGQQILSVPEKYLTPVENPEPPSKNDPLSEKPWFVWSDCGNNPVYLSSDGGEKIAELEYGAACAVVQVKSKSLLLARIEDVHKGFLMQGKKALGWVDFDKLLLWDHCLKTEQCLIDKKAMIINAIDSDYLNTPGQTPNFLNGPGSGYEAIGDAGYGISQFYFVYKETADYLLLGKSSLIQKSDFREYVAGWIPKKYCTIWNTNLALEINWHPDAVSERESLGSKVTVWENEIGAANFDKNDLFLLTESPTYQERTNGFKNRFIPLERNNTTTSNEANLPIKVGMISDIIPAFDKAEVEEMYNFLDMLEMLQKINIIFVVDATNSMESYSASISNAMQNAMRLIKENYSDESSSQNQFRFGAVLFRDEAEEQIVQSFGSQLSSNIDELGLWIKTTMNPQYNKNDRDIPEALYFGMQQALELYSLDPEETNYMIVIGDAGDHQNPDKVHTYIQEEEIINGLADFKMNLLAYQVNRPITKTYDNPYQDFENQLRRIMINSAKKVREGISISGVEEIEFEESGNNTFKLNSQSPLVGEIVISQPQSSITIQQLENHLTDAIQRIDNHTTILIEKIEQILEGTSMTFSIEHLIEILTYLHKEGLSNDDIMNIMSGLNTSMYQEGYTLMKPANAKYPWFQYVLLVESGELGNLSNYLKDLIASQNYPSSVKRSRLNDVFEEIFRAYLGNLSDIQRGNLTINDLYYCLTGLPGRSNINNFSLNDLRDPKRFTDKNVMEIIMDFEETSRIVDQILSLGKEYPNIRFPNSEEIYYWVPVDIFPHD